MIRVASGIWLKLLDTLGADGLTTPWGRVYIRPSCIHDSGLIAHELVHVAQIKRLGAVRFAVVYLYQLARYGYWNMPLEIEARKGETQCL